MTQHLALGSPFSECQSRIKMLPLTFLRFLAVRNPDILSPDDLDSYRLLSILTHALGGFVTLWPRLPCLRLRSYSMFCAGFLSEVTLC